MKAVNLFTTIIIIAILFLLQGCATILNKKSYIFDINTKPDSADVSVINKKGVEIFKGKTPAYVKLKPSAGYFSKAAYKVKLSMPGYTEKIIPIKFELSGLYFGNLLIGGVLGMLIVDPATGAMWSLDRPTSSIYETMVAIPSDSSVVNTSPELKIIDVKDVPDSIKGSLIKID
ncbi:MAG: hypothetical protein V4685_04830 [Bacteroidota bacterium]